VRPALPATNVPPPATVANLTVQQASTTAMMVQIASVSHQEDADVLAGALRKRGYAITEQRGSIDGMIRVEIGPFTNRDEANKMRLKLLSDGYNAVIQP